MPRYTYETNGTDIIPKDCGRIVINLKDVLEQKDISRNSLKQATKLDDAVINRLYKNEAQRVDLDVLARICYSIDCDITELFAYERPK